MEAAHDTMVNAVAWAGEGLARLEGLRLPGLDGVLGEKEQQMVAEVLFWAAAYGVATQAMARVAFRLLRGRTWFKKAALRAGVFCDNAQDDIPVMLLNGGHHLFGGLLMMSGSATGSPDLWKRGCMIEIGYELWDLIALAIGAYPHTHFVKPQMKMGTVVHHLPGLAICTMLILNDLHTSEHLQRLGFWLLLAGGVGILVCFVAQTCDFEKPSEMAQAAFFQVCGLVFFIYARFVVFPVDTLAFVREVQDPASGLSANVQYGVMAGAVSMSLFNVLMLVDVVPKTVRYVRRAIDSSVTIDDGPIPPTAAERYAAAAKAKSN